MQQILLIGDRQRHVRRDVGADIEIVVINLFRWCRSLPREREVSSGLSRSCQ